MQKQRWLGLPLRIWQGFSVLLLIMSLLIMRQLYWQKPAILPAPQVNFTTLQGQKIALKALRGKVVLITFWASDCQSCLQEIPSFSQFYQQFHTQGLEIIGVAMPYDNLKRVTEIIQYFQIPYPIAFDLNSEITHQFGDIQYTPVTFLINRQQQIVLKKLGLFEVNEMQQTIRKYLET